MRKQAIIVAGGSGQRMGNQTPKQFIELNGKPILLHSLERFYVFDSAASLIVVLPENHIPTWEKLKKKHSIEIPHQTTVGGETRFHSVRNGLALCDGTGLIAVHDAVRCLLTKKIIFEGFAMAQEKGTAVPAVPATDSLRRGNFESSKSVGRSEYHYVQTPQFFQAGILKKAYTQTFLEEFTDDASVVEATGNAITLFEGDPANIKITAPKDLVVAEMLLKNP